MKKMLIIRLRLVESPKIGWGTVSNVYVNSIHICLSSFAELSFLIDVSPLTLDQKLVLYKINGTISMFLV